MGIMGSSCCYQKRNIDEQKPLPESLTEEKNNKILFNKKQIKNEKNDFVENSVKKDFETFSPLNNEKLQFSSEIQKV